MENKLRKKFKKNDSIIGTRINISWPLLTEIIGSNMEYDYIEFLAEYAPFDHYDLENLSRAAELHDTSLIIKVDYHNRIYVAQKAIASGFQGVLFTDHTNAQEVRDTICKITPATPKLKGELGFINRRWIKNADLSNQLTYADEVSQIVKGFMIEKVEALENLDAICQVEGVDFIQFGPADFSMNSGMNRSDNEEYIKKVEKKIIETAQKYNVSVRIEIKYAKDAEYYQKLGVKHFALGTDLRILKDFYKQEGASLHAMMKGK